MLQRFRPAAWFAPFLAALVGLASPPLCGQSAPLSQNGRSVFQANARIVVLDVVVSGKNHKPLRGLQKQDFLLSEDGHPQTIRHFEEHTATQPVADHPSAPAGLQPDVFTNVPRVAPGDSVMVLVLDSLNTPLADQSNVRSQMLKYIKKPEQGRKIAIFTLGTQLRFVQGFTDDPALLAAAIDNHRKNRNGMQNSPLLQTSAEQGIDQELVAALREVHAVDAADAMQQFMADQDSNRSDVRIKVTLKALQELARYLSGIPGRKNVVWFSGAFPVVIFPNPALPNAFGAQRDDQEEIRKTDALLSSAQIAIYPIGAEGVATDSLYSAAGDPRLTTRQQLSHPQPEAQQRNANHAAMDEIARDTGGAAFYGTNSLADAMNRVAGHASDFYTLTYTSTNPATDGRFREIKVRLANAPGYLLSYRRGYYADDAKTVQTMVGAAAPKPATEPLSAFLRPGLPDSTQVPLTLRVLRGGTRTAPTVTPASRNQPPASSAQVGDNPNLKGPLTRYMVDFMVPPYGLLFEPGADGHHHVSVEFGLMLYDQKGRPVNWILRAVNLNLNAARYAAAQTSGLNLYLELDSPAEGARLRGGVYDLNANMAGTLEVPLSVVTPPMTASAR